MARSLFNQEFYPKIASNKWWDKYRGEKNVLIEDMDTSHVYQGYNLKIWADRYAFPVEVKNGADWIRPDVIIVTSNYSIKQVFPDPSIHLPLLERFKEVHKTERYDPKKAADALSCLKAKASLKKKQITKKRKFDEPKKAKKPFTQKADKIVPNTTTQMVIDIPVNSNKMDEIEAKLNATQEIAPSAEDIERRKKSPFNIAYEKEVIELADSSSDEMDCINEIYCSETCTECEKNIAYCKCYDCSDDDWHQITKEGNERYYDEDSSIHGDESSEDLFDI